jgi:hypothetical protein
MLRLWADRLWSICAGAGLVLLLAAEGNVCPHLLAAPRGPDSQAADSPGGRAPESPQALPDSSTADDGVEPGSTDPATQQNGPNTPSWSAVWPDAMPARRPWHADEAAQAELAGRRDGTVACGPLHQGPAGHSFAFDQPVPPWRADRYPPPLLAAVSQDFQSRPVRNPALVTVLSRTGPPC